MASLLALTCTAAAPAAEPGFGSPFHFTQTDGAAIYRAACQGCHMPDGQGAIGAAAYPALAADPRLASGPYVIQRVLRGRGAMPPFARMLTDDQIAAVAAFVRTDFGHTASPNPTAALVAAARADR